MILQVVLYRKVTRYFRVFYRILKILGCPHGCHDMARPSRGQGGVGSQVPVSSVETLRHRGMALLSRLLWYDKKQFKQFVSNLSEERDLTFLLTFLHGYLGFCVDPHNPFSTASMGTSTASGATSATATAATAVSGGHSSESYSIT